MFAVPLAMSEVSEEDMPHMFPVTAPPAPSTDATKLH